MIKRYKILVLLSLLIFSLFACKKSNDENISFIENVDNTANKTEEKNPRYEVCDINLYGHEVYVFKNQNDEQNLSILIKTNDNKCIVIDGGRDSDADFLFDFIKDNFDGHVNHWLITHAHDDHIGALYTILDKHKDDIIIEKIYYRFPDIFYAYNLIGEEAGIIALVQNKINEYSLSINNSSNKPKCKIFADIEMCNKIIEKSFDIEVMNNMYTIDNDLLNNSSMTYKITFKNQDDNDDKKTMFVLGDLSYDGGYRLLDDYKDNVENLHSDICVLAHHGQGGVDKKVYEAINPTYVIWPTTKKIYDNVDKKYHTDDTKRWLDDIKVKKQFTTIDDNILLR